MAQQKKNPICTIQCFIELNCSCGVPHMKKRRIKMNLIFFKKNEKKENGGRRINVIDKKIIK